MFGQRSPTGWSVDMPTFASLFKSETTIPLSDNPIITDYVSREGITPKMDTESPSPQGEQAVVGSTMPGWDSSSLQGGLAAVSSTMPGWDSSSLQGGLAAVSSPMPGWNSPMAGQLPVDWASSPTSPGWKVPQYTEWPNY